MTQTSVPGPLRGTRPTSDCLNGVSVGHPSAAFDDAIQRARAEFLEMPGMQLTEAQAARLWCFDSALCSAVLAALVESRFLVRTRNASFGRA